ncbi:MULTISPECIES: DMT family transporter [unclassified Lonepinella]|uniref:DMT family transporter n=1 Tax=unclassified Lonepinella TaxID=2642006 RepID=UPI0036DF6CF4
MQQNPVLGFFLALTAAMAWGSLPIALKQVTAVVSVETIIFYRFTVATTILFVFLAWKKKLPKLSQFNLQVFTWLGIGIIGLAGNFFLYNSSLNYVEPMIAQVFSPVSSFGMLLVGILLFKEKLGIHQKIGLVLLVLGLGLFFNDRFALFLNINIYSIGVICGFSAAIIWVLYGLAQKILARFFSTQQILMFMYFGCVLVFMPMSNYKQFDELSPFAWGCFIYCCLNTPLAYGAYAEALNQWEVSKVSVVVTVGPLFTLLFGHLIHAFDPTDFAKPEFNTLSYIGALLSVFGAMLAAIGHKLFNKRKNAL